jgi:hypothetical protein
MSNYDVSLAPHLYRLRRILVNQWRAECMNPCNINYTDGYLLQGSREGSISWKSEAGLMPVRLNHAQCHLLHSVHDWQHCCRCNILYFFHSEFAFYRSMVEIHCCTARCVFKGRFRRNFSFIWFTFFLQSRFQLCVLLSLFFFIDTNLNERCDWNMIICIRKW